MFWYPLKWIQPSSPYCGKNIFPPIRDSRWTLDWQVNQGMGVNHEWFNDCFPTIFLESHIFILVIYLYHNFIKLAGASISLSGTVFHGDD